MPQSARCSRRPPAAPLTRALRTPTPCPQNKTHNKSIENYAIVQELQELLYARRAYPSPAEQRWGVDIEGPLARFTAAAARRRRARRQPAGEPQPPDLRLLLLWAEHGGGGGGDKEEALLG